MAAIEQICFLLIWLFDFSQGANILLAPLQQPSHVMEVSHIGEGLVERGHEVYIAMSEGNPLNDIIAKRPGFHIIKYQLPETQITPYSLAVIQNLTDSIFTGTSRACGRKNSQIGAEDCKLMMHDGQFLQAVKSIPFKIAVVDGLFSSPCKVILPAYLGIPFVLESGAWTFGFVTRSPLLPSFVPDKFDTSNTDQMTFKQRLMNFVSTAMGFPGYTEASPGLIDKSLIQEFMPQYNSWRELTEKASLFITTRNFLLEWPQPYFPNVISVPALSARPPKPLDSSPVLQNLMDSSGENGVILVAFGTSVAVLPETFLQTLSNAFSQVQHAVLFKYSWPIPPSVTFSSNVHILTEWSPQNDLLGHKNTRIFITHCGNNGQYEAVYHAVPMIGIPMFADQFRNGLRLAAHGLGINLQGVNKFNARDLVNAIREITINETLKSNVLRASLILRGEPQHPRQKVASAIETVMEYGGEHLRSAAFDLEWYQYFMLDIIGLLVLVFTFISWILIKLILVIAPIMLNFNLPQILHKITLVVRQMVFKSSDKVQ